MVGKRKLSQIPPCGGETLDLEVHNLVSGFRARVPRNSRDGTVRKIECLRDETRRGFAAILCHAAARHVYRWWRPPTRGMPTTLQRPAPLPSTGLLSGVSLPSPLEFYPRGRRTRQLNTHSTESRKVCYPWHKLKPEVMAGADKRREPQKKLKKSRNIGTVYTTTGDHRPEGQVAKLLSLQPDFNLATHNAMFRTRS